MSATVTPIPNCAPKGVQDLLYSILVQAQQDGIELTTPYGAGDYEAIAASATDQVLGSAGATGDYLQGILLVPATTSPGAVSIKDGAGSAITVFTGGALSVTNLVSFYIPLGIVAATAWKVTTGADVSAIAVGKFT